MTITLDIVTTAALLFVVATGLLYLFDELISGVNWLYRRCAPRGLRRAREKPGPDEICCVFR